jgi:hypothetical protein
MSCRKRLCQECATSWDGIWYCAQCLGTRRVAQVERSSVLNWIAVVTTSLVLLYSGARVLVWAGAMIAGFF